MGQSAETTDWVSRFADEVIEESERRAPGKPVVVASGLSPSGPIHLGNLREVMTPHLVADEIRRRGHQVRHLISWDDYDRYRKVPAGVAGVDETWAEHIGKPLTSVPAPKGSAHPNWAEHFKAAMVEALAELGVEFDGISQTAQYTSGVYREQILHAMAHRADIDAILDQYRTKKAPAAKKQQQKPVDEAEVEAAEGSGAASEDDGSSGSAGYFPYKPYCGNCEKDLTTVTSYDDATTELSYTCNACGFSETVRLNAPRRDGWSGGYDRRGGREFGVLRSRRQQHRLDTRRRQARRGRLRQRDAVAGQPQRHQGLHRSLAAPCPAEAGVETRPVDETFLLQLDDLLVGTQLPQLHTAPQQERRDRGQEPPGQADPLHVLVRRDVGDTAHRVPGRLHRDHEQHRDHRVHAHAQRVRPGRRAVEGDRGGRQQPGRLTQEGEGDTDPREEQIQGQQDTDARVDADREDVTEVPEALFDGELTDGRVRPREADAGDDHGAEHDHADEHAVHSSQLHGRGHPYSPPCTCCCAQQSGTCVLRTGGR